VKIRLHPQARVDLESAADWYDENAGRSVAADFIEAYAQSTEFLREHPEIGRPDVKGARSIFFRRFPYSLVYRIDQEGILVVAVAHWRRRPMFWSKRK